MPKNKKPILAIAGIIAVLIATLIVFLLLNNETSSIEKKQQEISEQISFPEFPSFSTEELENIQQNQEYIQNLQSKQKMIKLSDSISGASFNQEINKVLYFEKTTGNVFQINPDGTEKQRITSNNIPKISDVFWSPKGDKAVLKIISENETGIKESARFFSIYSIINDSNELGGIFLPPNTYFVSASPFEDKILYAVNGEEAVFFTSSFENKDKKEVLSSPFGDFTGQWMDKNSILLTTKPSAFYPGYLYKLSLKTGGLTKIIGDIKGLTALSIFSGKKLLYSEAENKTLKTIIYDTLKETNEVSYKTIPEKCFFSASEKLYCAISYQIPPGNYPDDWYKGKMTFSDSLFIFNFKTGTTKAIVEKSNFDIINIFTDPAENRVFFQDKKDGSLWSINLII